MLLARIQTLEYKYVLFCTADANAYRQTGEIVADSDKSDWWSQLKNEQHHAATQTV